MYHNLYDSHCHSEHSPDGRESLEQLVNAAVAIGLKGLAVTDHFESDGLDGYDYKSGILASAAKIKKLRRALNGKIELSCGIELGNPQWNTQLAKQILAAADFDFVLGSIHHMVGYESFYYMNYSEMTPREIDDMLRVYYIQTLGFVNTVDFDVLAHMTLPLRYMMLYYNRTADIKRYSDEIDAVLRALVDRCKGMELNTSGLRGRLADTMPPFWIIKRFYELGGVYVTIGSDAHTLRDLGAGLQQSMGILAQAGFSHFAFYRGRAPRLVELA